MNHIKVRTLKEGMKFSHPLVDDSGITVFSAFKELKRDDINRFIQQGYIELYTEGKRTDNMADEEKQSSINEQIHADIKQKHEKLAEQEANPDDEDKKVVQEKKQSKPMQSAPVSKGPQEINVDVPKPEPKKPARAAFVGETKEEIEKARIYEKKLNKMELLEQMVDSYSILIASFMKSTLYAKSFVSKIQDIGQLIITEVRESPYEYLDLISFLDFGNPLISHSVKTAIIGVFISMKKELSYKKALVVAIASLLHDIGKVTYPLVNEAEDIQVPKESLNLGVTHPVYGYKTAKDLLKVPQEISQAILNHHEQPDGKGFPRRINEFKLSTADKVVAMANVMANLIKKNDHNGYFIPIKQIRFISNKYPGKFEHDFIHIITDLLMPENPGYKLQYETLELQYAAERGNQVEA